MTTPRTRSTTDVPAKPPIQDGLAGNSLFAKVEGYFHRYGRPEPGSRILVAVSGGPDSVALLHVLVELSPKSGWIVGVAHVDHGMRGEESDADAAFVSQLASNLGLTFHSHCLDPHATRTERNVQAWARTERYRFLTSTSEQHGYSHIAVAHQLDDRAETIAAAVLDAAGTFALSGIPPVRGRIIRPLFDASRKNIVEYLGARGISYRIDSSNESDKYQRNRIRHIVLPLWEADNPCVVEGLARLGEQLWVQRRFLEEQATGIVDQSIWSADTGGLTLHVAELMRHDPALDPYILRELVSRLGLDMVPRDATVSRFAELRNWKDHRGTYSLEQGDMSLRLSQGLMKVCKIAVHSRCREKGAERLVAPSLVTRVVDAVAPGRSDDKVLARFDLDAVEGVVSVRWPKAGDRYQPLGLQGTKKLSDLLADRKVPSFARPQVPVVVDDQGILWPVGHPIAHRARLTDRTRRVMEARLQEGSWKSSC